MGLEIVPITFKDACAFIARHHRHHKPPIGHKFSLGLSDGEQIVGVATVGRPVSRMMDDGRTAEVNRLCTDGTPNACSKLYAAAWRVAKNMGYRKLITYILDTESGVSLNASGWRLVGTAGGGSWSSPSSPSRPRTDKAPVQKKLKYEVAIV